MVKMCFVLRGAWKTELFSPQKTYGEGILTLEQAVIPNQPLSNNILRFYEIVSLPITTDITKLDAGNGIASTFMKLSTNWRNTCYNKLNSEITYGLNVH